MKNKDMPLSEITPIIMAPNKNDLEELLNNECQRMIASPAQRRCKQSPRKQEQRLSEITKSLWDI